MTASVEARACGGQNVFVPPSHASFYEIEAQPSSTTRAVSRILSGTRPACHRPKYLSTGY
ncbi:MAG: hypothetical protein JWO52_4295 [Gammaproteobacteria bacterium]|jgi:hypothetical protein|nr:hypothetical protein [Gammaproteobacteria bacterium]